MKILASILTLLTAMQLFMSDGWAQGSDLYPDVLGIEPFINAEFTLDVRVVNWGTRDSTNLLETTVVLPEGLTLISASVSNYRGQGANLIYDPPANPNVSINGRTLKFRPHPIPGHWYRSLWMVVWTPSAGFYTNDVSISPGSGWTDSNPANNSLTHIVEVSPPKLRVIGGRSVGEGSGSNSIFVVQLSSTNTVPVSVGYDTVDWTARAGEDFQATSGTITFPPGTLERTVEVPVLNDSLSEPSTQTFSLSLRNPVNAVLGAYWDYNHIIDDEPALTVSASDAAPVFEGDTGFATVSFPITLPGPSDAPVLVSFNSPSPLTNGTVLIPRGATSAPVNLFVPGDFIIESNRTVQLTLVGASYDFGIAEVSIARAQALGTILDDDMLPGKFHHLEISDVPSPQLVGRPIPIRVTLKDCFDNIITTPGEIVTLTASILVGQVYQHAHVVVLPNIVNGVGQAAVTFTNKAANAIVTAWRAMGEGYATAMTPVFQVKPMPTLFLSAPGGGTEGDGVLATPGRVSITNIDVQDIEVQLTVTDSLELSVPSSVFIPAGQTSVTFAVTVVDDTRLDGSTRPDGSRGTQILASSPGYLSAAASVIVHDNESATLTVTMATNTFMEGSGMFSGTVTASRAVDEDTWVYASASDYTELGLSCCLLIPAGSTSTTFGLLLLNDNLFDGPRTVTLTARVQNWVEGTASITILDNDTNLFIGPGGANKLPGEGAGTITNSMVVSLPGNSIAPVTVELVSSDPTEILVPPSVVIPTGQRSAPVTVAYPDDSEFDGTQTVTITATVPGIRPATMTVQVEDNDVHHLLFSPVTNQTSGVPFRISVTAKDVNDVTMTSLRETIALHGRAGSSTLPVRPSSFSNFLRGTWSGNVTLDSWGTNLQLVATAPNGVSAASNPFTVPIPAWAANLRIQYIQPRPDGAELLFHTVTGKLYHIETTPRPGDAAWQPIGAGTPGTGGPVSFLDTNAASANQRFYRLSVMP